MTNVVNSIFDVIFEMKRKPRTGWSDHEIENPETVWQHSADMRKKARILAWKYHSKKAVDHCGSLASIHDVTEGICHDVTPHCGINALQKRELED